MNYVNQLVSKGRNQYGGRILKINSGKSYRLGLELTLAKVSEKKTERNRKYYFEPK